MSGQINHVMYIKPLPSIPGPSCSETHIKVEVCSEGNMETSQDMCTLTPDFSSYTEKQVDASPALAQEVVLSKSNWGGKRIPLWTFESSEELLRLVRENYKRFQDRKTKKITIWWEITKALQEVIPGVRVRQVEMKWRKLKAQFAIFEAKKSSTGRGRRTEPMHYDTIASILKSHPLSQASSYALKGTADSQESLSALGQAPDAPHPAPVTPQQQEPPQHPKRTKIRRLRLSREGMAILGTLKSIEGTVKKCSESSQKHTREMAELVRRIDSQEMERHEMEMEMRSEAHQLDMEIKREKLEILRLQRMELEERARLRYEAPPMKGG